MGSGVSLHRVCFGCVCCMCTYVRTYVRTYVCVSVCVCVMHTTWGYCLWFVGAFLRNWTGMYLVAGMTDHPALLTRLLTYGASVIPPSLLPLPLGMGIYPIHSLGWVHILLRCCVYSTCYSSYEYGGCLLSSLVIFILLPPLLHYVILQQALAVVVVEQTTQLRCVHHSKHSIESTREKIVGIICSLVANDTVQTEFPTLIWHLMGESYMMLKEISPYNYIEGISVEFSKNRRNVEYEHIVQL